MLLSSAGHLRSFVRRERVLRDMRAAMADAGSVRSRVLAEAARFRAMLPVLLPRYREQWVVFRDGDVVSAHANEEEAYVSGLNQFGPSGGHVVAVVREPEVVVLSAAVWFGL
jgi:hypothetical protein